MRFEDLQSLVLQRGLDEGIINSYREQIVAHADQMQELMVALLRECLHHDDCTDPVVRAKHRKIMEIKYGQLLERLLILGLSIGINAEGALEEVIT
jgi:hypothetical protein